MGARGDIDVAGLVERAQAADVRAVARLITLVENGGRSGNPSGGPPARGGVAAGGDGSMLRQEIAAALAPLRGRAQVVGITGSPGVGKSTSTSALVTALRADGKRVGVLAVDPSSPFSGGALLGDRVRMQEHATDREVFIRSLASRGQLGGLSAAVPQAVRVLDAARCDVILIETVGVGQAEVEIASLADTTLVLLAPGLGDGIQAAKAGILEIADVFVVNKADRDGANQLARELKHMQALGGRHSEPGAWRPPIVKTVASAGQGADDVIAAVAKHHEWMIAHGELERRRVARAAREVEAIALDTVREQFTAARGATSLDDAAAEVAAGRTDPYTAAASLVDSLSGV